MDRAIDDRLSTAEAFLREVIYHARTGQAAAAALARLSALDPNTTDAPNAPGDIGRCGLGEKAFHALDLSRQGAALLAQVFPVAASFDVEGLRSVMHAWIDEQDKLDRQRNHFLKAFRTAHGFDRGAYAPELLAQFDAGLARVNAEEDAARRRMAQALITGANAT